MKKMKNMLPGGDRASSRTGKKTARVRSLKREWGKALVLAAGGSLALVVLFLGMDAARASTDTTFQGPLDTIEGIVGGTGGQLAAALAVGAALVGSVLRFNAMQLMGAVGVGVAAGAGVGIVTGLVGTSIV